MLQSRFRFSSSPSRDQTSEQEDAAESLHRRALVIDTHNDVTQQLVVEGVNLRNRLPDGQSDIPRMREGGVDGEFLSVFVPSRLYPGAKAYAQSLAQFDAIDAMVAANGDCAVLARTARAVSAAAASGKRLSHRRRRGHSLGDGTDAELLERPNVFYRRGAAT